MKQSTTLKLSLLLVLQLFFLQAQDQTKSALLDIDRIYSGEFEEETERTIQWIEGGDAYVIIEKSQSLPGADELIRYPDIRIMIPGSGNPNTKTDNHIAQFVIDGGFVMT